MAFHKTEQVLTKYKACLLALYYWSFHILQVQMVS